METIKYFARIDGEELGAFSLKELIQLPQINSDTLIWHKGLDKWVQLKETDIYSQFLNCQKQKEEQRIKDDKNEKKIRYAVFGLILLVVTLFLYTIFKSQNSKNIDLKEVEAVKTYDNENESSTKANANTLLDKFSRIEKKIKELNRCSKDENINCVVSHFSFPLYSYFNKSNLSKSDLEELFKSSFNNLTYQELKIDSIKPSMVISNVDFDPTTKHSVKLKADVYGVFYYQLDNSEVQSRKVHDVYYFDENENIISVLKEKNNHNSSKGIEIQSEVKNNSFCEFNFMDLPKNIQDKYFEHGNTASASRNKRNFIAEKYLVMVDFQNSIAVICLGGKYKILQVSKIGSKIDNINGKRKLILEWNFKSENMFLEIIVDNKNLTNLSPYEGSFEFRGRMYLKDKVGGHKGTDIFGVRW